MNRPETLSSLTSRPAADLVAAVMHWPAYGERLVTAGKLPARDLATGGYGLGLAIVRLVLEQHDGRAIADASPLGGARFTLSWPRLHSVTQS